MSQGKLQRQLRNCKKSTEFCFPLVNNLLQSQSPPEVLVTMMSSKYEVLNNAPVFKQVDSIYENRLRQFIDEGQYKEFNLPKFYDKARIDNSKDEDNLDGGYIDFKAYEVPQTDRPLFKDVIGKVTFDRKAHKGDSFGPSWKTFWFHVHIRVPKAWIGEDEVWLDWDCGNEGLLYTKDGTPLQAFTGGERTFFILPKQWQDGKEHTFYIEISCNGMFGVGSPGSMSPPDPNRYFQLSKADLVLPNLEARALKIDYWIITDAAREFGSDSWQKYRARQVATEIIEAFDPDDVKSIDKCRKIAQEYIGKHADSEQVYLDSNGALNKIDVYGIGNCHIDTAWLWPFGETRRKIVRSWTTQLDLLDRYPEYQFVASQAQQFKWLKQDHPDIFKKVQEKAAQNQFIPIGGSWVENDTNMPTGESLARQLLFGQRFFLTHFGKKSRTYWLPDTFGYSSQIPQICRLAGFDTFLTQKLSWNNINNFPNTSFNWIALDGTQILTHMPPANTYTADANFGDVKRSISQHKNLSYDQTGLLLFGKGDGGGGPSPEMLDKLRRCRGISNTVGLLPSVHLGHSVDDFFDDLLKRTDNGKKLVSWVGEMYLEFHRGTYTTQALVKKLMRRSEIRLHDLELFASFASLLNPEYKYPQKELHRIWEDVLLCQFHDVLPGSCIEMVYKDDVRPMLKNVVKKLDILIKRAVNALVSAEKPSKSLKVLNTLQWRRNGILKAPKSSCVSGGSQMISQSSNKHSYVLFENSNSVNATDVTKIKYPASVEEIDEGIFVLTNGKLKVKIEGGLLTSLYDLVNDREVLDLKTSDSKFGANQYVLLEDTPLSFEAWDTELYSLDKYQYLKNGTVDINEEGPLRVSVLVQQKISEKSSIKTIISLDGLWDLNDESYVEFDTKVDWNESRKFLKVEFPVNVHADFASYETQFGLTKRPTHYNTSWDVAKFEVCHHKFADYSDFSYGVSIINDSKYGFSTHGNLMRLSLLRSPKEPDANADIAQKHHFKYALYPHKGPLGPKTVEVAYNFNYEILPDYFVSGSTDTSFLDLVRIKGDESLILSNVKRAEDDHDVSIGELPLKDSGHKSLIIRVYESLGGQGRGFLTTNGKILAAKKVNLLEEEIEDIKFSKASTGKITEIPIKLRAFEVASYKLIFNY